MSEQEDTQRRVLAVARKIMDVQRSLSAFDHDGDQYLPKAVNQAILDTEYAFAHKDYDRAEHMCKVTAFLVSYYKTKHLAAGPEKWIARWKDLHSPPNTPDTAGEVRACGDEAGGDMTDEQKRAVVLFASMLSLAVSVGVLDKLKAK